MSEKKKAAAASESPMHYYTRIAFTLLAIAGAVALMLGCVNAVTEGKIAELKAQKLEAAMREVLPGYTVQGDSWSNDVATVSQMTDGSSTAWCVSVAPKGFGGNISMTVSVLRGDDGELRVGRVSVMSHAETMGDPKSESFLGQYSGLTNGIVLGGGDNGIDAMTGATVSSKAITLGVNNALDAVRDALAQSVFGESEVNG